MIWIIFVSLHLIGLVGYTLLLRKSALGTIDKYLLAAILQTGVFLPALLYLPSHARAIGSLSPWQWLALVVSGFLIAGLHLLSIKALQHLEASVFIIIFNLRLLLVTILGAIFLSEFPSVPQLLGGLVILLSIITLNLHRHRRYATVPVLIGLGLTVWFSFHATLEKYNILQVGLPVTMLVAGGLATLILWGLVARRGVKRSDVKKALDWHMAQLLVYRLFSAWGYLFALLYGSLAVTNYISGLSVVLIVLFGVVFLKETSYLREKVIAGTIAFIGLTLILIGKL